MALTAPSSESISGLRVWWFTPDKPDNVSVGRRRIADHLEAMGAQVTLVGTTPGTVWRAIREPTTADVFVGTTRAGAVAATVLGTLTRRPVVIDHVDPIRQFATTHPRWLARVVERLENLSFRLAAATLYVYEEEEGRVRSRSKRATQTDLGVEVERFTPTPESRAVGRDLLEEAGVSGQVAVYVGGLEPLYNVEAMLGAARHLENWTLVLAGAGSLAPRVRAAAEEDDGIVYLGSLAHDRIPPLLHASDVGLSLVDDAHTLKVLEYGVAGLPVVQLAGRAEDRFGDRVEYCSRDRAAVARAIRRAGSRDGDALRAFARQYDWRRIAETYGAVLASVSQG